MLVHTRAKSLTRAKHVREWCENCFLLALVLQEICLNSKDKGTSEEQSSTTFDMKFMLEAMNKEWNRRWEMMTERLDQISETRGGSSQKPHRTQQKGRTH